VGQPRALGLLLSGRVLTANEALDWGLVTEVHDDAQCRGRAEGLAKSLAAGPALALGQAKRLVRASWESTRDEVGQEEARTIAQAVGDPEAALRIEAFLGRPRSSTSGTRTDTTGHG
jgi:2-(1,2-epoxy-1,2-dihydrophenyl)acetyl-CoA isomerase